MNTSYSNAILKLTLRHVTDNLLFYKLDCESATSLLSVEKVHHLDSKIYSCCTSASGSIAG